MAELKGLPTLIRLHKWIVDEKRRALGLLLERETQLIEALAEHERELQREQALAANDATEAGFLYGAYADRWKSRRDHMQQLLDQVRHEIELAREDLAGAYRELKTYEEALALRQEREREEEARREQMRLDEIAQQQHSQKSQR